MDVALTVAEQVTMMHDGRVIVEGTPGEIRPTSWSTTSTWAGGTMAASEPVLAVKGLNAYYGRAHVLQDVDVRDGRRVGRDHRPQRHGQDDPLPRRSWALMPPAAQGSVRFDGKELMGKPSYQIADAGIGYVPQGRRLFQSLTVDEHFRMLRSPNGGSALDASTGSTTCSRAWPSDERSAGRSSRAASSRCSRSGGRC